MISPFVLLDTYSFVPPTSVVNLLKLRHEAREAKDYALADKYRDDITAKGYRVEDTPRGLRLKYVEPCGRIIF